MTAATPWRWPSPYHRFATRLRVAATPDEEPEVELALFKLGAGFVNGRLVERNERKSAA